MIPLASARSWTTGVNCRPPSRRTRLLLLLSSCSRRGSPTARQSRRAWSLIPTSTHRLSVRTMIVALVAHARMLGIPMGDEVTRSALVFLGPDGQLVLGDACGECDDAGDSSALSAIGGGASLGSSTQRGNKCKFCSCFTCQSELHGGPLACKCRWDSADPLTDLSPGAKGYVHMARQWHEANKTAATLKGVEFTVRRARDGDDGDTTGSQRYRRPRRLTHATDGPGADRFTGTAANPRPNGSLALITEVDEEMGDEPEATAASDGGALLPIDPSGGVSTITTSLKELLGEPGLDDDDFESWLQQNDDCSPGIMALECRPDDELVIEGVQQSAGVTARVLCPMFTRSGLSVDQSAQAERDQLVERMAQMEAIIADQVKTEPTTGGPAAAPGAQTEPAPNGTEAAAPAAATSAGPPSATSADPPSNPPVNSPLCAFRCARMDVIVSVIRLVFISPCGISTPISKSY